MLWLLILKRVKFLCTFLIHGKLCCFIIYTMFIRYNICIAWFLDIRISTCSSYSCLSKYKVILTRSDNRECASMDKQCIVNFKQQKPQISLGTNIV